MEVLKCPFCCDGFFNSRQSLIKHLSRYAKNVPCPICDTKYFDINTLIDHIGDCKASNKLIEINVNPCFDADDNPETIISTSECDGVSQAQDTEEEDTHISATFPAKFVRDSVLVNHNYARMELISKSDESFVIRNQDGKRHNINEYSGCNEDIECTTIIEENDNKSVAQMKEGPTDQILQTQEYLTEFMDANKTREEQQLELFNANGESEFVFVQTDHHPTSMLGDPDANEIEIDETMLDVHENGQNQEQNNIDVVEQCNSPLQQEDSTVFSCTTCNVSFTSVLEHIKTYHNDQDVVVEMNATSSVDQVIKKSPNSPQASEETEFINPERRLSGPQETEKRVITETGQIETFVLPIEYKKESTSNTKQQKRTTVEKVLDSKGRLYTRKIVQIGKFWKDKPLPKKKETKKTIITESTEGNNKVHHTVLKMVDGPDGKVKAYHCVACGVSVKTIEEFKKKPCESSSPVNPDSGVNDTQKKVTKVVSKKSVKSAKEKVVAEKAKIEKEDFFCNVCCTTFKSNKSLRLHVRMHDPVKSRPIIPPRKMDVEDKFNYYNCKDCDKSIPLSYKSAHEMYHKTTTQYHCDICNRIFISEENLLMHMNVHTTDKISKPKVNKSLPYTCIYCNKQFARPHEKVKHERIHTGEKPYKCEVCGKTFRITYCLTLHMRTHSGDRPYECKLCGKRFKAHSVYNHHLMTHSEVRAYKCPFCPKAFKTAVLLSGHKNSHTKPFACTVCNRRFASLYAVRMHMEYHQKRNRLQYSCTICGAIYARKFALRDHIKQDHSEQSNESDFESFILKQFTLSKIDDEAEIATQAIIEESDTTI